MINCLIVDDEELARALIKNYIARVPHLSLVGECKTPLEAMQVLQSNTVDVIFLDIQMPELTGVDFVKTLSQKPFIVFTTAYSEYAIEGYTLDVIDYLLKPIAFDRFLKTINKISERTKPQVQDNQSVTTTEEIKDYIVIKSEHRLHRLKFNDIIYIEGMREYVAFHTLSSGRILSLMSLKQLEEELPSSHFIRIHKSTIVAFQHISSIEGNLAFIGKTQLVIGPNYREEVIGRVFS